MEHAGSQLEVALDAISHTVSLIPPDSRDTRWMVVLRRAVPPMFPMPVIESYHEERAAYQRFQEMSVAAGLATTGDPDTLSERFEVAQEIVKTGVPIADVLRMYIDRDSDEC